MLVTGSILECQRLSCVVLYDRWRSPTMRRHRKMHAPSFRCSARFGCRLSGVRVRWLLGHREAAMTAAFAIGPVGEVIGLIAGAIVGKPCGSDRGSAEAGASTIYAGVPGVACYGSSKNRLGSGPSLPCGSLRFAAGVFSET